MRRNIYSVAQVNQYIRRMFEQDILLSSISIKGEVSNLKYHTSGHIYFSIKDESGVLSCVMFRGDRKGLSHAMRDGDRIVATGTVSVYERGGNYQFYVKEIELEGEGLLYERFLKLKKELEEMGMFDPIYKRAVKTYNRRIGIVTAPTGAAIRDIQNIASRRNPYAELYLYPALVQGEGAKESIAKGIRALDSFGVDVIIVGRGGGSLEDLWAFNEEEVARAIFECSTPVISAVGHETDTTIADFAADLRAPTPSAAAEIAVFDYAAFVRTCGEKKNRLGNAAMRAVLQNRHRVEQYRVRLMRRSPEARLRDRRMRLAEAGDALQNAIAAQLEKTRTRHGVLKDDLQRKMSERLYRCQIRRTALIGRLKGLNPLTRLEQGFSYVENASGRGVRTVGAIRPGELLTIHVTDGRIRASVIDAERKDPM